ncbi:MAG: hypothetical protein JOZ65_15900 [Chloroflexi bacterium]|nr:hypothetical protein [Chloroflexota bacterium]
MPQRMFLSSAARAHLDHFGHKAARLGGIDVGLAAHTRVYAAGGSGAILQAANRLTEDESHWCKTLVEDARRCNERAIRAQD